MSGIQKEKQHIVSVHFNLQPYHAARYAGFVGMHGEDYHLTSLLLRPTAEYALVDQKFSPAEGFVVERLPELAGKGGLDRMISQKLRELGPDVILLLGGYSDPSMLIVVRWATQNKVPLVMCSESKADDHARSRVKEWLKCRICGLFSAALVGGSPHKDYALQLGFPANAVFLGYDAVDNRYFADGCETARDETERWRAHFGLPDRFFLASARFIEKKNFKLLFKAYAEYRRRLIAGGQSPWHLVLLGGGPLEEALQQACIDHGISDMVHMPGFKQYPELPAFYALASCFIHPSTREEWGLVVNEAMASELPVVVSNRVGCARDLVKDGMNGFTFDPYNVEELAGLMAKVSSMTENSRATMGECSRTIISEWGPERFASGLKSALEKAMEIGPKRAGFADRILLSVLIRL